MTAVGFKKGRKWNFNFIYRCACITKKKFRSKGHLHESHFFGMNKCGQTPSIMQYRPKGKDSSKNTQGNSISEKCPWCPILSFSLNPED